MKLSQMTTDQGADALLIVAPEIEKLVNDNVLIEKFTKRKKSANREESIKIGLSTILNIATYLLKTHRESTWIILGALNCKSYEEIGKQAFPLTIKQIIEVFNDEELMSFFTSSEKSEPVE